MNFLKIEIPRAKMNGLVERCKNAKTPKDLFLALLEFAKWILSNPTLLPILKIIREKEEAAKKYRKDFEDAGSEELKLKHTVIRNYAIGQKVPNQMVIQVLDTFRDQLKESPQLSRALLLPLEQALEFLLADVSLDGQADFEQVFGKINRIKDYKFMRTEDSFPKFHAWENACAYFAQEQQTADWDSLNQIRIFVERYDFFLYDKLVNELIEKGLDAGPLQEEHRILMRYALSGVRSSEHFPTIEEYKSHVMRLVESIIEIMSALAEAAANEFTYKYSDEDGVRNGILERGAERQELHGNSAELMYAMSLNPKNVHWHDIIGGGLEFKSQIDEARKAINTGFRKAFSISEDLVPSTKGFLSINSLFSIKLVN